MTHIPVLKKEVLEYLDPKPNDNFIDCTINGGGHALAVLEKIKPNGKVLGVDWDKKIISRLKLKNKNSEFKNKLILACDNYANLKKIVEDYKFKPVQGILFDLGFSSWHLEESGRGFTFLKDEPLDMRYGVEDGLTAEEIINQWPVEKIEEILKEYGNEKFAKRIAKKIAENRKIKPIKTTFKLVEIIKKAIPSKYGYDRIHFATRTFQALRIAANGELENLKKVLPLALEILAPKGRLAVISFHSLESKIVKNFFREKAKNGLIENLTKKAIKASKEEIEINSRSRSAQLRVAEKINN